MPTQTPTAQTPTTQTPTAASSKVLRVPPADPATAAAHFHRRFTFEADVADVHADVESGAGGFVLVDSRSAEAWAQGHIPGAVHLPTDEIGARAAELVPPASVVVTYCWGPGCNGATRAAYAFASAGYRVKEMLGGFEYWSREGFPVEDSAGTRQSPPDPLTAPVGPDASCGC
ncbi:rhodanese-like domain-containing protein [Streptomyces sp. 2132.2]|uniref:rhodanese-like domain-containing protein n=1 Tax=Streptomyces sp. 2132.2 TaxID=2485161 RepID=UPI000C178876|nr:rhodanese-like domain-containing protein [Streptomyces sp. 2132.2]